MCLILKKSCPCILLSGVIHGDDDDEVVRVNMPPGKKTRQNTRETKTLVHFYVLYVYLYFFIFSDYRYR